MHFRLQRYTIEEKKNSLHIHLNCKSCMFSMRKITHMPMLSNVVTMSHENKNVFGTKLNNRGHLQKLEIKETKY